MGARVGGLVTRLGLVLVLLACSPAEPVDYEGHGRLVGIDRRHRALEIDHDAIPGFMQAMTMTFDVAPGVDLESLEPDTPVDFTLHSQGRSLTVTAIRPVASD
ncbi:MAG: copper-binding protein [Myxococcota bacterium]